MSDPDDEPTMASYYADHDPPEPEGDEHLAWLTEGWIEERVRRSALANRFKKRIWTCQDGSTVPIDQMTDRHLTNAHRMLKRKGFVSVQTFKFYLTDPGPNGEHACDAFNEEVDHVLSCCVSPWLDVLEEEIEKRGLKT